MPVARLTGHRIRAGTYAVVDITSGYAISALPAQTDQEFWEWALDARLTTPPRRARQSRTANMTQVADGKYSFQWGFSILTHLMLDHWMDSFLPGSAESALVSVLTYDERDTVTYLNCTLFRPASFGKPVFGGWQDVVFELAGGTIIT